MLRLSLLASYRDCGKWGKPRKYELETRLFPSVQSPWLLIRPCSYRLSSVVYKSPVKKNSTCLFICAVFSFVFVLFQGFILSSGWGKVTKDFLLGFSKLFLLKLILLFPQLKLLRCYHVCSCLRFLIKILIKETTKINMILHLLCECLFSTIVIQPICFIL